MHQIIALTFMEQKLQEIQEAYRNSCNVYKLIKLEDNKNRKNRTPVPGQLGHFNLP